MKWVVLWKTKRWSIPLKICDFEVLKSQVSQYKVLGCYVWLKFFINIELTAVNLFRSKLNLYLMFIFTYLLVLTLISIS